MIIKMINTGTKDGYRDYHGDIESDNKKVGGWDYDKNQRLMIATIGSKRFYAKTVEGLTKKILRNYMSGKLL